MASREELLRGIPQVNDIISHPALALGRSVHLAVVEAAREVLGELRDDILDNLRDTLPDRDGIAGAILARMRENERPSLRKVINATGVILHTNLGRAPLAESAVKAMRDVAEGYSTLEYDASEGVRDSRHSHVEKLLFKLTGAEEAMVVNNNAAAVLLVLSAMAKGREVIVSRGELIEIGGAFRIPDVMAQSGSILREIGTTNRTRLADYENAIIPGMTGALFKAHTSNYKIIGFTEEASLTELSELGRRHFIPVLYDLGGGALISADGCGLTDEPCVQDCLKAGADVVCFSGDKLLGGPQAGVILGKKELLARMKKHPLARALRVDKLTLAALEATLRLYLDPERARVEIPVLRMLSAGSEEMRENACRLAASLAGLNGQVRVIDSEGQVGGGAAPTRILPSAAVEIIPSGMSVVALEKRLRERKTPIVSRIAHDRLLLDVRTIAKSDFTYVAESLISILGDEA